MKTRGGYSRIQHQPDGISWDEEQARKAKKEAYRAAREPRPPEKRTKSILARSKAWVLAQTAPFTELEFREALQLSERRSWGMLRRLTRSQHVNHATERYWVAWYPPYELPYRDLTRADLLLRLEAAREKEKQDRCR